MKRIAVALLAVAACQGGGPTSLDMVPADPAASLSASVSDVELNGGKPLVIAGFDAARGGAFSLGGGSFVDEAIASLETHGNVTIMPFFELTAAALAGADMVILFSATGNISHIKKLSAVEQQVLLEFVGGGGCAILGPNNDSFGGPTTGDANNSLIAPFGMEINFTVGGTVSVQVLRTASPVTDGPFGTVTTFKQLFPGVFTELGPATSLAVSQHGDAALAVIERHTLSAGAGPVVVYSDISTFADPGAESQGFLQ
ncbi:MAG: hypothetical protein O7I93_08450 [Gemmatimonadetes bacterium]|nr:hypothetical protein [Gemmatimonadota bacterium]